MTTPTNKDDTTGPDPADSEPQADEIGPNSPPGTRRRAIPHLQIGGAVAVVAILIVLAISIAGTGEHAQSPGQDNPDQPSTDTQIRG